MKGRGEGSLREHGHGPEGMLFVWTDVQEEFEKDFNRWYDQEHIEERVRIPGVISAARYRAVSGGRRYLGLYRTESVQVFDTDAYRIAFIAQTPWSVLNLSRMRNPMRRVGAVLNETGLGTGAWLAVLSPRSAITSWCALKAAGVRAQETDGIVSSRLLVPDSEKSSPLPNEALVPRMMNPILLIEGTDEAVCLRVAHEAAQTISGEIADCSVLQMMWQLQRSDLKRSNPSTPLPKYE